MTTSKITAGILKTTSENQSYPRVIRYMRTGREFKETTYLDDSLFDTPRYLIPLVRGNVLSGEDVPLFVGEYIPWIYHSYTLHIPFIF